MAFHPDITRKDDVTVALDAANAAVRIASKQLTGNAGTVEIPNADGTSTIMGVGAGDTGVAAWVGDTTAPGKPLGITASSTSGMVVVNWTGEIDGGIPNDFAKILVFVDGVPEGPLVERGTLAAGPYATGSIHSVYAIAYDDAHDASGNSTPNASAQSDTVSVVIVGSDIDSSQLGITVTKSSVAPSSENVGEHKGDLWLQYDADPDSNGAGLKAEWWWTGLQWESIPVAIYLDQLAARQINADSAVIGLLSSGIVQSGLFRTSDSVGNPSYKFAWTGSPNNSTSTLSQDGQVVATNLVTDPAWYAHTPRTWQAKITKNGAFWDVVKNGNPSTVYPIGQKEALSALTANTDYVVVTQVSGQVSIARPFDQTRGISNYSAAIVGDYVVCRVHVDTLDIRNLFFHVDLIDASIKIGMVGVFTLADWQAMQALGVTWFDGDSDGDGNGVIVDGSGVRAYDSSGALTVNIPSDGGTPMFTGGFQTGGDGNRIKVSEENGVGRLQLLENTSEVGALRIFHNENGYAYVQLGAGVDGIQIASSTNEPDPLQPTVKITSTYSTRIYGGGGVNIGGTWFADELSLLPTSPGQVGSVGTIGFAGGVRYVYDGNGSWQEYDTRVVSTNLTDFFTPASGFTQYNNESQVYRSGGLWHLHIAVEGSIPSNTYTIIGTVKEEYRPLKAQRGIACMTSGWTGGAWMDPIGANNGDVQAGRVHVGNKSGSNGISWATLDFVYPDTQFHQ